MKQYLDIATLAGRLQVKRSTLYAWAERGSIPHLKLGRLLRFDPDEIETWLKSHRRELNFKRDSTAPPGQETAPIT